MLSIFPDLFTYSIVGVTLIRFAIGLIGVYLGFKILSKRNFIGDFFSARKIPLSYLSPWLLGILLIISGGLMFIGLFVQLTCIVLAFLILEVLIIDSWSKALQNGAPLYLALIIISLSFLFLGPGILAFDLPF